MEDSYPQIDTIKLYMSNGMRSGSINVYIKDGTAAEIIDKIFLDILYKINNEPMSSYLKGSSNYKNKIWVNLSIFFMDKSIVDILQDPINILTGLQMIINKNRLGKIVLQVKNIVIQIISNR